MKRRGMRWLRRVLVLVLISLGAGDVREVPGRRPESPVYVRQAVTQKVATTGQEVPRVVIPPTERERFVVSEPERKGDGWSVSLAYVPEKAGKQWMPGVEVRSEDEVVRTLPRPLDVRPLPSFGRPSNFAGGVGATEATAEVEPVCVTIGDRFVYRVRLTGMGAIGATNPLGMETLEQPGFDVVRGPEIQRSAEPPSSSFAWTLRATKAGTLRIPASTFSTFDPESRRYVSRTVPGVSLQVDDVQALSVGEVLRDLPSMERTSQRGPAWLWWAVIGAVVLVLLAGAVARSRGRSVRAEWVAAKQARTLECVEADEVAGAVLEGLVLYLARARNRDRGPLTPPEAAEAVAAATGQAELGAEAERLVTLCDRTLYREP
ncbi:MAG TPA: BatD family protein, partial [Isosphaeraceae bacterium]|nr:BatD family protein [Isosphaeraceae bacterium]